MTAVSYYLGIDPGVAAGMGFFTLAAPHLIIAEDLPVVASEVYADALAERLRQMGPVAAMVERVGPMPKQGVSSTFKFGAAYGAIRATIAAVGIPCHLVAPTVWKKAYRLSSDKEDARAEAIRRWPGAGCFVRKKDHNRADAALLAHYAATVLGGGGAP